MKNTGSLMLKRKMWRGRYTPADGEETEKNGAIPEPVFAIAMSDVVYVYTG